MRKDVFVVDPPTEETPGKYILMISRGGMFGSSTTAFAVDQLWFPQGEKGTIQGVLAEPTTYPHKVVVEFSPESSYIMIERTLARPTNMLEIEVEDRKSAEEHKKAIELEFPDTAEKKEPEYRPGNYA